MELPVEVTLLRRNLIVVLEASVNPEISVPVCVAQDVVLEKAVVPEMIVFLKFPEPSLSSNEPVLSPEPTLYSLHFQS